MKLSLTNRKVWPDEVHGLESPESNRNGNPPITYCVPGIKFAAIVAIVIALGINTTAIADVRLVGKTFSHAWTVNHFPEDWPTPKYVTLFCDERTAVWNNVTDMGNVYSGVIHYELTEIDPGILQVTWKESPDTAKFGITWTLNFRTWAIYGVLVNVNPKSNYSVAGGFNFRDGLLPETPLAGCP